MQSPDIRLLLVVVVVVVIEVIEVIEVIVVVVAVAVAVAVLGAQLGRVASSETLQVDNSSSEYRGGDGIARMMEQSDKSLIRELPRTSPNDSRFPPCQ